jgi:hypothetical protein
MAAKTSFFLFVGSSVDVKNYNLNFLIDVTFIKYPFDKLTGSRNREQKVRYPNKQSLSALFIRPFPVYLIESDTQVRTQSIISKSKPPTVM